jgi:hypothetical protein
MKPNSSHRMTLGLALIPIAWLIVSLVATLRFFTAIRISDPFRGGDRAFGRP